MTVKTAPKHRIRAYQLGLLVAAIAVWETLLRTSVIDPFFFPRPSAIAGRVADWLSRGDVYRHLYITFSETVLSFIIGTVLGIGIGLWLALTPTALKVLDPYIKGFNAVPRIVLAPIFTLWFGLGIASKVALGVTLV